MASPLKRLKKSDGGISNKIANRISSRLSDDSGAKSGDIFRDKLNGKRKILKFKFQINCRFGSFRLSNSKYYFFSSIV